MGSPGAKCKDVGLPGKLLVAELHTTVLSLGGGESFPKVQFGFVSNGNGLVAKSQSPGSPLPESVPLQTTKVYAVPLGPESSGVIETQRLNAVPPGTGTSTLVCGPATGAGGIEKMPSPDAPLPGPM